MGLLSAITGALGGKDPSKKADKYLQQVPGQLKPYYDPYIQAGQKALPTLEEQYQMLLQNPQALIQQLGRTYQESPGYQTTLKAGLNAAENAAAAGGMTGSPQHQEQAAGIATGLANQDYYNYLNQVMGLYGQGLGGYQDLNNQGFGASNELAQSLANNLMSRANLKYAGTVNQNQARGGMLGTLVGGGLGFASGGPMGALKGAKLGSSLMRSA